MPHDCKVKKFTIIEHDTTRSSFNSAEFSGCTGTTGDFTHDTGFWNNLIYGKHDHHIVGFSNGSYVLTGTSGELIQGLENELPSGGDYVYQLTAQFFFPGKHTNPPYNAKDSITAQGIQVYDNNVNDGDLNVPLKLTITGGTGKYKHANGTVKLIALGCLPISETNPTLVAKYKYKFKVYLPGC